MIKTMPIRLRVVALVSGLLFAANTLADFSESHFVRVSVDGGIAAEFTQQKWQDKKWQEYTPDVYSQNLQGSAGGVGSLGVGYRYANNGFLLDMGVGVAYTYLKNGLRDSTSDVTHAVYEKNPNIVFGKEDDYTERYSYARRLSVQVPIMMGGEWQCWYALGGVKVNIGVDYRLQETCRVTPYMTGDMWWAKDPVTGQSNTDFSQENRISVGDGRQQLSGGEPYGSGYSKEDPTFDVRLCAEFGYRLNYRNTARGYHGNERRMDYYIGAFMECGVVSKSGLEPQVVDENKKTIEVCGGKLSTYLPFEFGVRMTAIFELKKKPAFRWEEPQRGDAGKKRIPNRHTW